MASYATLTDITDRFGATFIQDIADRDGDGVEEDPSVTKALADATATIDSYVSAKYDDPQSISPTPPIFVRLCVDIAVYYLARENRGSLSNEIRQGYEDAVAELKMIAKGEIGLGVADPPATAGTTTQLRSFPRIVDRDQTEGLI